MAPRIGYTSGVFDLFHVGHLNVLRNARSLCDHLIVGVSTDELVYKYKKKNPVIPYLERAEIVRNIRYVDTVVAQYHMDKVALVDQLKVDIIFVGDDWLGSDKWEKIENKLSEKNIKLVYFPYTKGISSTKINRILDTYRMEE